MYVKHTSMYLMYPRYTFSSPHPHATTFNEKLKWTCALNSCAHLNKKLPQRGALEELNYVNLSKTLESVLSFMYSTPINEIFNNDFRISYTKYHNSEHIRQKHCLSYDCCVFSLFPPWLRAEWLCVFSNYVYN